METETKHRDVDRGWAWVALTSSFLLNTLTSFQIYSAGVLQVVLLEKFQQGNTETSLVGSMFGSVLCVSGPFVGMLINATNCRFTVIFGGIITTIGFCLAFFANSLTIITVTYGLIAGVGSGFCSVPCYVMVGYSFDRYRGLATGVVVAGGGIGLIFSGPFTQYLLDEYGLSGTYLIMAGVSCQLIVVGALMRPSGPERKQHQHMRSRITNNKLCSLTSIFDFSLFTNLPFMLFIGSVFLYYAATNTVFIQLPNFAVVKGSTDIEASILMLQIGIGSTFSRLLSGVMTSRDAGLDPFLLSVGSLGLSALLTLTFPLYSSRYWQQALFSILFGIYNSAFVGFLYFVCLAIVGISKFSSAFGLIYLTNGIGYLVGPTLAGLLIDETGYYESVFYFSGGCFTCAVLLILLSSLYRDVDEESAQQHSSYGGSDLLPSSYQSLTLHVETANLDIFDEEQIVIEDSNTSIHNSSESLPLKT